MLVGISVVPVTFERCVKRMFDLIGLETVFSHNNKPILSSLTRKLSPLRP